MDKFNRRWAYHQLQDNPSLTLPQHYDEPLYDTPSAHSISLPLIYPPSLGYCNGEV